MTRDSGWRSTSCRMTVEYWNVQRYEWKERQELRGGMNSRQDVPIVEQKKCWIGTVG